eukprot:s1025_g7.t1
MTLTVTPPAMDDPAALRKLLGDCLLSSIMIEHIIGQGYTTIALIAHAIKDPDQVEAFAQHLSLVPTSEVPTILSPVCSSSPCSERVHECGPGHWPCSCSAADAKELKDQFQQNYPGEFLTPSMTPSVAFLAFIKEAIGSRTLAWVPWKRRSFESDEIEAAENRRPRNDKQFIRSILADGDVGLGELPEARVDTGGPVELALSLQPVSMPSGKCPGDEWGLSPAGDEEVSREVFGIGSIEAT